MLRFRFKACIKCGGDLALDDGDWICLQCGTYYYVGLYRGARGVGPVVTTGPIDGAAERMGRGEEERSQGLAIVSRLGSESWIALGLMVGALGPELIKQ